MKRLFLLVFTLTLGYSGLPVQANEKQVDCNLGSGAGRSEHNPPEKIAVGQPIVLYETLSRRNAPGCENGALQASFTNVRCNFRFTEERDFIELPMELVADDGERLTYSCTIPYPAQTPVKLEYYFERSLNGVYSRRNEKPILIDSNLIKPVNE